MQALAALEPAPEPEAPSPAPVTHRDPMQTFTQLARAVRMTAALEARLSQPVQDQQALAWRAEALQARRRRKAHVFAIARQIVETDGHEINRRQNLDALDASFDTEHEEDDEADFGNLPIGVLVARICRDLGIRPNWAPWAATDWAHEEARAQAHGSPFTGPHAPPLRRRSQARAGGPAP